MPDVRYKRCKGCGRKSDEVGPLSWSRLCPDCALARLEENMEGIRAGEGYAHERRLYGIARQAFGPRVALALKQAGAFPALDARTNGH